jgi:HEAT repeat protein
MPTPDTRADAVAALASPDTSAVQAALRTLSQHGTVASAAVPAVIALLDHADSTTAIRRDALWALGRIADDKSAQAVPALIATLSDETHDSSIRIEAAWALGYIADAAAPALAAAFCVVSSNECGYGRSKSPHTSILRYN